MFNEEANQCARLNSQIHTASLDHKHRERNLQHLRDGERTADRRLKNGWHMKVVVGRLQSRVLTVSDDEDDEDDDAETTWESLKWSETGKWNICFYVHIKFVWCYSDLFFTSGAFFGNYEDFLDFCFRSSGLIEILFHCLNYSNCIIIHFMDVDGSKCVYNATQINRSPSETSSEGADGFRN